MTRRTPPGNHRVLLVFADGVGLGAAAALDNPFTAASAPALTTLLGGRLDRSRLQHHGELALAALDACLGVPGLPQSATGQTTLFTGLNAQGQLGRHVPALPGPRLRALLAEHSLLAALAGDGYAVTFANAYTEDYAARLVSGAVRASATTHAVLAAGVPLRLLAELSRGEAVTWDVTGEDFARRAGLSPAGLPIAAERAGRQLARLAAAHHLTLYETFLTDLAGHGRWGVTPESAVRRLDGLLAGVLAERPAALTVLLTSDHGNVEETAHSRHTRNPVPLLAVGPAAPSFASLTRLDQVAPRVREVVAGAAP